MSVCRMYFRTGLYPRGAMGTYALPRQAKMASFTVIMKTSSRQPPSLKGWHMIKFKIHAPECTEHRIFIQIIFQEFQTAPPAGGKKPLPHATCTSTFVPVAFTHLEVWLQACRKECEETARVHIP